MQQGLNKTEIWILSLTYKVLSLIMSRFITILCEYAIAYCLKHPNIYAHRRRFGIIFCSLSGH